MTGMFPNVQNSKLQVECRFGDKCAYTQLNLLMKKKKCSNCYNSHYGE